MLLISSIVWWFLIAFIDSSLWKKFVRINSSPAPDFEEVDQDIIKEENKVKT
jgi:hypothetical protein